MQKSFSGVRQLLQVGPARARLTGTRGGVVGTGFSIFIHRRCDKFRRVEVQKAPEPKQNSHHSPGGRNRARSHPQSAAQRCNGETALVSCVGGNPHSAARPGSGGGGFAGCRVRLPGGLFSQEPARGPRGLYRESKVRLSLFPRALARGPEPEVLTPEEGPGT